MKYLIFCFCLFISFLHAELSRSVIVSVAPYKYFVERIAGDDVKVILMIPASASPHNYEPSPKEVLRASRADIWFRIGEGFEKRAIEAIKSHHSELKIVDLRKGLPLLPAFDHHCHDGKCCSESAFDLHIWVSLRLAEKDAVMIAKALSDAYPEHKEKFEQNLQQFINDLRALDEKISNRFTPLKGKTIMVSHPAYAYFSQDYGIKQLSIEFEGKEPTPQAMNKILETAKKLNVKTIFVQAQYGTKAADLMASILGAKVVMLDPYAEDYLNNFESMADKIAEGL